MVQEIRYINIREVLSRILRHPLLQETNLEQAIQYTIDFIGIFGMPDFYEDKEADIEIEDYRGLLPCDLIEINMVKECSTNIPLRAMTGVFNPGDKYYNDRRHEPQFKTQGRVIITSFKCGNIHISYKAIHVDDEGLPMIIDNTKFLKALELYIKCQVFTMLFDMGRITEHVLSHTEQEYAWAAGQLEAEFKIPSMSEMESITRMMNQMIVRNNEFDYRFERLGNKEYNKVHNNNSMFKDKISNLFSYGQPRHKEEKPEPQSSRVQPTQDTEPYSDSTCSDEALTIDELREIFV